MCGRPDCGDAHVAVNICQKQTLPSEHINCPLCLLCVNYPMGKMTLFFFSMFTSFLSPINENTSPSQIYHGSSLSGEIIHAIECFLPVD